jgi:hypothetical protein
MKNDPNLKKVCFHRLLKEVIYDKFALNLQFLFNRIFSVPTFIIYVAVISCKFFKNK